MLLNANLILNEKMGCSVAVFGKFCVFPYFLSFWPFFKEKNLIFSWAFLKKSCSLIDPLFIMIVLAKTIYVNISRQI